MRRRTRRPAGGRAADGRRLPRRRRAHRVGGRRRSTTTRRRRRRRPPRPTAPRDAAEPAPSTSGAGDDGAAADLRRRRRRCVDERRRPPVPRARLGRPRRAVLRRAPRLRPRRPTHQRHGDDHDARRPARSTSIALDADGPRRRVGHASTASRRRSSRRPTELLDHARRRPSGRPPGRRRGDLPRRRSTTSRARLRRSAPGGTRPPTGSYVLNEPDGARSWLPSNDTPADKATWHFELTVPAGVTAVANGHLGRAAAGRRRHDVGLGRSRSRWRPTSCSC